jgi:hypothetical protein
MAIRLSRKHADGLKNQPNGSDSNHWQNCANESLYWANHEASMYCLLLERQGNKSQPQTKSFTHGSTAPAAPIQTFHK